MKQYGQILLAFLIIAAVMPSVAREPVTLARLRELATSDAATPEGKAYLKEFFTNPWMLAFDHADEQCRAASSRSGALEEFVLALSIGDNGYPIDVLVSPDNEGLRCLADRLKATAFIRPPHDGFAIYMPFKQTEPGTEHLSTESKEGTIGAMSGQTKRE